MNASAFDSGYFPYRREFLGADRILDVYFDSAPSDPTVDYRGHIIVTAVIFNGVDITAALTPEDLKCIAEDISDAPQHDETWLETEEK